MPRRGTLKPTVNLVALSLNLVSAPCPNAPIERVGPTHRSQRGRLVGRIGAPTSRCNGHVYHPAQKDRFLRRSWSGPFAAQAGSLTVLDVVSVLGRDVGWQPARV